jgi:hypothetical protein
MPPPPKKLLTAEEDFSDEKLLALGEEVAAALVAMSGDLELLTRQMNEKAGSITAYADQRRLNNGVKRYNAVFFRKLMQHIRAGKVSGIITPDNVTFRLLTQPSDKNANEFDKMTEKMIAIPVPANTESAQQCPEDAQKITQMLQAWASADAVVTEMNARVKRLRLFGNNNNNNNMLAPRAYKITIDSGQLPTQKIVKLGAFINTFSAVLVDLIYQPKTQTLILYALFNVNDLANNFKRVQQYVDAQETNPIRVHYFSATKSTTAPKRARNAFDNNNNNANTSKRKRNAPKQLL